MYNCVDENGTGPRRVLDAQSTARRGRGITGIFGRVPKNYYTISPRLKDSHSAYPSEVAADYSWEFTLCSVAALRANQPRGQVVALPGPHQTGREGGLNKSEDRRKPQPTWLWIGRKIRGEAKASTVTRVTVLAGF